MKLWMGNMTEDIHIIIKIINEYRVTFKVAKWGLAI
jgi:hypothetical protein